MTRVQKSDEQVTAEIQAEHDAVIKKAISQAMCEIADIRAMWAEEDHKRRNDGGGPDHSAQKRRRPGHHSRPRPAVT